MADITLSNNAAQHRYEIRSDGALAGYAEYNLLAEDILFSHTEIDPQFEGQGMGSKLARHALDDVRAQGKHAIPVCKFIAGFLHKHPEYQDLVKAEHRAAFKV